MLSIPTYDFKTTLVNILINLQFLQSDVNLFVYYCYLFFYLCIYSLTHQISFTQNFNHIKVQFIVFVDVTNVTWFWNSTRTNFGSIPESFLFGERAKMFSYLCIYIAFVCIS